MDTDFQWWTTVLIVAFFFFQMNMIFVSSINATENEQELKMLRNGYS